MKKQMDCVHEFHESFQLHTEVEPTANLPGDLTDLRARLIEEELNEYRAAAARGDIVEVADALTDMLYVLLGTYITHGLQDVAEDLFALVHSSNMTKLDENGQPVYREDGKIQKPEGYTHPDLEPILAAPSSAKPEIAR